MPVLKQRLTAAESAELAGIATSTWRSMVSRGQAPRYDRLMYGRPLWERDTVERWIATRPGQGARTDVYRQRANAAKQAKIKAALEAKQA